MAIKSGRAAAGIARTLLATSTMSNSSRTNSKGMNSLTAAVPCGRRLRSAHAVAIAGVLLGVGYVDLAIGGSTLAPVLLVIGYVVGVPLAILTR